MNEFLLSREQKDAITVDDLTRLILHILQLNDQKTENARARRVDYSPRQLGNICHFEFCDTRNIEPRHPAFEHKCAEAKQRLYQGGFVYQDPGQMSDDFVCLTEKGRTADTSQPVIGVATAPDFIKWVGKEWPDLDAVVRQYLMEGYSAIAAGLWLSATFMLGAAGERILHVVAGHVDALLEDPKESAKLSTLWKAKEVKDWISGHLQALKQRYPDDKDALTQLGEVLDTLYTLYRIMRNDVGHPRDTPLEPEPTQVRANLLSFNVLAKRVAAVLEISP
jgi:hypothetical protein